MHACMCVHLSPATIRLHNKSHFEYPMKYIKLPEKKFKKNKKLL